MKWNGRRSQIGLVVLSMAAVVAVCASPVCGQIPTPTAQIDPALLAKANAGDAGAAISVGEAYATAPGRAQDCKQAATWYEKAGGIAGAMHLAGLYRDGCKLLPRDMAQAAQWYAKAADLGDPTAQGTLGTLYFFGQGVAQNYVEAYFWLDLASRSASPKQQQYAQNRQLAGAHITADEVDAAKDRVDNWLYNHTKK
jgi:hypothetical protein